MSVEVRGGEVIVRVPNRTSRRTADEFVRSHWDWIRKHLEKSRVQQEQLNSVEKLTQAELDELYRRAKAFFPGRARYYADLLGVDFGRITIRCQRSRWGSCSAKKNLNFNCLLMLTPPQVIDSVVAHEVCHLVEMNHSDRFYSLLLKIFPDYRRWNKWLKENGKEIMARVPDDQ
jgi:hypothetical protein